MNRQQRRSQERKKNKPSNEFRTWDCIDNTINFNGYDGIVLVIENLDVENFLNNFKLIEKKKDILGKVWISFNGYEKDPREIYEIEETRNFLIELIEKKKDILIYLNLESLILVFSSLFFIRKYSNGLCQVDTEKSNHFLKNYSEEVLFKLDGSKYNICFKNFKQLLGSFQCV